MFNRATFNRGMFHQTVLDDAIFAGSLLETSLAQRSRRSWTTLTSFGLQAAIISLLLLVPLLNTVGVPRGRTVSTPVSLGRPSAGRAQQPQQAQASAPRSSSTAARIVAPGTIPPRIATGPDDAPSAPPPDFTGLGRIGDGRGNGSPLPDLSSGNYAVAAPRPPAPTVRTFKTSSMLEGSLIHRVVPVYPYPAKLAHVQGAVLLAAIIGKDGTMQDLQVMSGHPLLTGAAIEAVRQWRYKPYILNGEPIEVETRITVNFTLGN